MGALTETTSGKELALLIPIAASALAISYDVGYFYGVEISFFTLFSVSEHIVFALQAIPLIFLVLAGSRCISWG